MILQVVVVNYELRNYINDKSVQSSLQYHDARVPLLVFIDFKIISFLSEVLKVKGTEFLPQTLIF